MKKLLLVLSLATCASTMAFAQTQAPMQGGAMQGGGMQQGNGMQGNTMRSQFMQACGTDMQSYCASAQSRDDRRACVMANHDKFSDSCKSFMAAHPMHEHPQGGQ
jgi:hypothetical protein